MNRVIVDTTIRARLDNLNSAMELCDESGATLGYFVPASDWKRALYKWIQESVTDEELHHAFKESGEYSLQEVLADLNDKMKDTVVWKPAAKRQIAEIWMQAPNRKEVAAAANAIDANLRLNPHSCGESRGASYRLVIEISLAAFYAVNEEDRLVTVFYVRFIPSRLP